MTTPAGRAVPPASVPTLTEVVSLPIEAAPSPTPAPPAYAPPVAAAPQVVAAPPAVAAPPIDEAALARDLLAAIQQQVDLAIEIKLREALAPVLTRATDTLVREARRELTTALRELVQRAVDAELTRRRSG